MIRRLRREKQSRSLGRSLCDSAVRQARTPALYEAMGAPDTVEGRFELLTLHVILLIEALRDLGAETVPSSQALFDSYLGDLDGALREMGVGDLTVGKRMRALGQAFYGRAAAYRSAFAALPDRSELQGLIQRTILDSDPRLLGDKLADYVIDCRKALADQGKGLYGAVNWPEP